MSWVQKLYETYENCSSMIGAENGENKVPLLPICHTTQKAHIEIVIDGKGNFKRARVVPWEEARTIIPATEDSAGRTHINAHALNDKLQYVAKDYHRYGGKKKSGYEKNPKEKNKKEIYFHDQLADWCSSTNNHPKAVAVLKYVEKGTVIRDLINHQVLIVGNRDKLLEKWGKDRTEGVPEIFKVIAEQVEAFIRWEVQVPSDRCSKTWEDHTLWDSWIRYYTSTKEKKDVCYVTGKNQFIADQHPKKIRNDGDGAKLISSNDSSGFTFRGRFLNADQAAGVGFEVTQKAHSALRWLISRQGYQKDDQAIVAWAISGKDIPQPFSDSFDILGLNELPNDESPVAYTAQDIAIKFKNRIAGYGSELGNTDGIVVMGLDSATPGRIAITFYRELTGSDYLERINRWHDTCSWIHHYRFVETQEDNKVKRKSLPFIGAPSPSDIAEAAYATNNKGKFQIDGTIRKSTVARILPCIIDGQLLPRHIVESVVRRASNRVGLEEWQWQKAMSIACALYKKFNEKEDYSMALDQNRRTRDYLYGRLLAIADSLENWALNKANEDRQTNAARLMNRFAERPYSTWRTIELSLSPYKARLGGKSKKRQRMIDEVKGLFDPNDFINDKRLSGEFLLGYSCQREYLRNDPDKFKESDEASEENSNSN